ncbi:GIY-YIG nuclease family protein [Algoriphagus namhaensis]
MTSGFFCFLACYFYILHSVLLDKFYLGKTCDSFEEKLPNHLSDHDGFTSKSKDWKLVHQEEFPGKKTAYLRERTVKSWKSKKKIEALLSNVG